MLLENQRILNFNEDGNYSRARVADIVEDGASTKIAPANRKKKRRLMVAERLVIALKASKK